MLMLQVKFVDKSLVLVQISFKWDYWVMSTLMYWNFNKIPEYLVHHCLFCLVSVPKGKKSQY